MSITIALDYIIQPAFEPLQGVKDRWSLLMSRWVVPFLLWLSQKYSFKVLSRQLDRLFINPDLYDAATKKSHLTNCIAVFEKTERMLEVLSPARINQLVYFERKIVQDIRVFQDELHWYIEGLTDLLYPDHAGIAPHLSEIKAYADDHFNRVSQ